MSASGTVRPSSLLEAKTRKRRISVVRVAVPFAIGVFTVVYGLIRLPAVDAVTAGADKLTVGMVQTNLGSHEKTTSPAQFMRQHLDMSLELVRRRPDLDLLVWPESVYDGLIRKDGSQPANQAIAALGTPTIMGALTIDDANHDGEAKYFNSIVLISGKGELLSWFDKVELLAFGETLPLSRLIPQINKLFGGSWFTHGTSYRHLRLGDTTFLPTVCFEDIVPSPSATTLEQRRPGRRARQCDERLLVRQYSRAEDSPGARKFSCDRITPGAHSFNEYRHQCHCGPGGPHRRTYRSIDTRDENCRRASDQGRIINDLYAFRRRDRVDRLSVHARRSDCGLSTA